MISLPHISQLYIMFRARLLDLDFGPGAESLEVRLYHEHEIPWEELAFRTIARTLRNYFLDRKLGAFPTRVSTLERRARARAEIASPKNGAWCFAARRSAVTGMRAPSRHRR